MSVPKELSVRDNLVEPEVTITFGGRYKCQPSSTEFSLPERAVVNAQLGRTFGVSTGRSIGMVASERYSSDIPAEYISELAASVLTTIEMLLLAFV